MNITVDVIAGSKLMAKEFFNKPIRQTINGKQKKHQKKYNNNNNNNKNMKYESKISSVGSFHFQKNEEKVQRENQKIGEREATGKIAPLYL